MEQAPDDMQQSHMTCGPSVQCEYRGRPQNPPTKVRELFWNQQYSSIVD